MKYFRIFSNASAYTEYMQSEDAVIPNMSYCYEDNRVFLTDSPYDVLYRWVNLDPTIDWICNSTSKYYKQQRQISTDGGDTWENVSPAQYQQGSLIEEQSTDCGYIPPTPSLVIEGASVVSAETCQYNVIYGNYIDVTTSSTWSIVSGSQYATINSSNGEMTILSSANNSLVEIQAIYSGITATKTVTLTYLNGASSDTSTETTTDASGNTTTVTTTVTTYGDGSSSETSESVIINEFGELVGTSQSNKETNADGSYNGSTVNYDAEGNPTDGSNVTGDTDNNVSTQSIEYDESGNTVVVGYDIDTSGSQDGTKTFNLDGANTDYYAFDLTHGFILDFNFTIDFRNQPSGQDQNHHNILTAKRADPSPWYGFQLRHSKTDLAITLGTQFDGGSNTNTTIYGSTISGSLVEYDLTITYNPTASTNSFVCYNNISSSNVFTSNSKFPDIDALKYIKIVIGYAVNSSGNPFRYSNINVKNFNLRRN